MWLVWRQEPAPVMVVAIKFELPHHCRMRDLRPNEFIEIGGVGAQGQRATLTRRGPRTAGVAKPAESLPKTCSTFKSGTSILV
jgi:hypothetical protein